MAPIGPLGFRRGPENMRQRVDMAAATAWEALVDSHTSHALRFLALVADRMNFDEALDRYLDELDVHEPMASAVRSRVLIALEKALRKQPPRPRRPTHERPDIDHGEDEARGLQRFRPDRLVKGIAEKVRASGEVDESIRLAVARAEDGVILAHVENAVEFVAVLRGHEPLHEAVDDYLELMRVSGGRAQSVHQRTMSHLADIYLPWGEEDEGSAIEAVAEEERSSNDHPG